MGYKDSFVDKYPYLVSADESGKWVYTDNSDTYYIPDSGTKNISENGLYDVTEYANANVNVPSVEPTGTRNITANGIYDVANYANANVNVPIYPDDRQLNIEIVHGVSLGFSSHMLFYYYNGSQIEIEPMFDISGDNLVAVCSIRGGCAASLEFESIASSASASFITDAFDNAELPILFGYEDGLGQIGFVSAIYESGNIITITLTE